MLKRFTPLAYSLVLGLLLLPQAIAGEADFKQQIHIKAEDQNLDGVTKTLILTRNVAISQGTLLIKADRVEVVKGENSGESFEVIVATGNPASYQQDLDNGETVFASANEIRYEVANRILTMAGDAKLDRDTIKMTSNNIVFDLIKEQVRAADSEGVETVLSPESFNQLKEKDSEQ